jgi:hypothetical protein
VLFISCPQHIMCCCWRIEVYWHIMCCEVSDTTKHVHPPVLNCVSLYAPSCTLLLTAPATACTHWVKYMPCSCFPCSPVPLWDPIPGGPFVEEFGTTAHCLYHALFQVLLLVWKPSLAEAAAN